MQYMRSTKYNKKEEGSSMRSDKYCPLHQTQFLTTVAHINDLPSDELHEIAFVGRSNAGKSTSINVLCHQRQLAFTSKLPGRTQHINYFSVKSKGKNVAYLVDLPGYGFASVPLSIKQKWQKLITYYLQNRNNLKGLIILIDARHPLNLLDKKMIDWFIPTGKPIHILLTKADKLNYQKRLHALSHMKEIIKNLQHQQIDDIHNKIGKKNDDLTLQLFSSTQKIGVDELTNKIISWLHL